jgi:hypothetical protein
VLFLLDFVITTIHEWYRSTNRRNGILISFPFNAALQVSQMRPTFLVLCTRNFKDSRYHHGGSSTFCIRLVIYFHTSFIVQ